MSFLKNINIYDIETRRKYAKQYKRRNNIGNENNILHEHK